MAKFCPDGKTQSGFKIGDSWSTPNFISSFVDYVDIDGTLDFENIFFLDNIDDNRNGIMFDALTHNMCLESAVKEAVKKHNGKIILPAAIAEIFIEEDPELFGGKDLVLI